MKTLSNLIIDFFAARRRKSQKISDSKSNTNHSTKTKTQFNETENHATTGASLLAPSSVEGSDQPSDTQLGEKHPLEPEAKSEYGDLDESAPQSEPEQGEEKDSDINPETLIEKAYQRGLIEGRNQIIEETYFPKNDDGIPHFHGSPARVKASSDVFSSDIFSMARKA